VQGCVIPDAGGAHDLLHRDAIDPLACEQLPRSHLQLILRVK
jgi:hypothetical protein